MRDLESMHLQELTKFGCKISFIQLDMGFLFEFPNGFKWQSVDSSLEESIASMNAWLLKHKYEELSGQSPGADKGVDV